MDQSKCSDCRAQALVKTELGVVLGFIITLLIFPISVSADNVTALHVEPWYELIHDDSDPDKIVLNLHEQCTPVAGDKWIVEYGRAPDRSVVMQYNLSPGGGSPAMVCPVPDEGIWHVGMIMVDDYDGIEHIVLKHDGTAFGVIYGEEDDDDFTMYVAPEPITTEADDHIYFYFDEPVGCYRLRSLVFWRTPIEPPELDIRDFTVHTLLEGQTQVTWWLDRDVAPGVLTITLTGPGGSQSHPVQTNGSVHRVIFDDLVQGANYTGTLKRGYIVLHAFNFVAGLASAPPPQSVPRVIHLRIDEPTDSPRSAYPVLSGIPFPPGELGSINHLSLFHGDQPAPLQADVLSRWSDNSIQWVLISFLADTNPTNPARYTLHVSNNPGLPPTPAYPVSATVQEDEVVVENGLIKMIVGGNGGFLDRIWLDRDGDGLFSSDEQITTGGRQDLVLVNEEGVPFHIDPPDQVMLLSQGPLRTEVLLSGQHSVNTPQHATFMRYRLRLRLFADNPIVELTYTLDVDGPREKNRIQRLSLHLRVPDAVQGTIGTRPLVPLSPCPPSQPALSVLQDYDFSRLVDQVREGDKDHPVHEDGFALITTASEPVLQVVSAVEDFWQTYPKGLALIQDGLRIDLMPQLDRLQYLVDNDDRDHVHSLFFWCERELPYPIKPGWGYAPGYGGQYKVRRGMRVQSTVRLAFITEQDLAESTAKHLLQPLFAVADPEVYLRSTWFGNVDPVVPGFFHHYESMFSRFFQRIKQVQNNDVNDPWDGFKGVYGAYGWMNYGDSYPEQRGYNWHNQEYDYPWAVFLQFARTGRTELLWFAERGARHLATIDTRHHIGTEQPLSPTNYAGLPWKHSIGHVGEFFPYPFYRDRNQLEQWVTGSQDPFGHVVLHGLYTAGFLTGERNYVEVANRAADKIAELTSAGKDTSPWGFEFTQLRRPGWIINNMTVGYLATSDPYLLNAARMARERTLMRQTEYELALNTGAVPLPIGESDWEIYGTKTFDVGVFGESLFRLDRVSSDSRTPGSLQNFARFLIHTNYKESIFDFWYFYPNCYPDPDDNKNSGTIVMSTLAAGIDAAPGPGMNWVKNVLLYLMSRYGGRTTPYAASLGYAARSMPEALYILRRWGFANTAPVPGVLPLHDPFEPTDPDQYPCNSIPPGAPGCGEYPPREVCGDGFNNDLSHSQSPNFDEAGFYVIVPTPTPAPLIPEPPDVIETSCPESNYPCLTGELKTCGSDVGECQSGLMVCTPEGTWGECTGYTGSQLEQPDGLDNDCDGFVDEN